MELTLTANAQPALMAHSLAVIRVLEAEKGLDLKASVSSSPGIAWADVPPCARPARSRFQQTAKLLRIRGNAMQEAVPAGQGAMAALLARANGISPSRSPARRLRASAVMSANDNGGGQVVLSGDKTAIDRACVIAEGKGRRARDLLPVSAPFHSRLMQPAAEAMQGALATATILAPKVPVVANVAADAVTDPEVIRRNLVAQVTGSVRWRESMLWLGAAGVTRFVECGSGKVLTGSQNGLLRGVRQVL